MASSVEIRVEAGSDIEPLLKNVLTALTDDEIDEMQVKREFAPVSGLASEPITTAAIIVASLKAATALGTALAAYIKLKTEKLKAEVPRSGGTQEPVSIVITTSKAAPSSLKNLKSSDYVKVRVLS